MSKSTDDAFRELSGSVLSLVALAEEAFAAGASSGRPGLLPAVTRMMGAVLEGAGRTRLPRPSSLMGVLEGLVSADGPAVTRGAYRPGPPRVEPSPIHPDGLAAAVLNVPPAEIEEFLEVVVGRYLKQLHRGWMGAAVRAFRARGLAEVSDARFAELFESTVLSRFLNPVLDPPDRRAFAGVLAGARRKGAILKVDLAALAALDTFEGIHAAPTCSLFTRDRDSGHLTPLAIRTGDVVLTPSDGAAWDLAKYFVLQGAGLSLVLGVHPGVHFPMDAVNAVTKAELPAGHVIRRLLEPHLYMQLPLNYAVLYVNRSVAHNDQREIYTPFPGSKDGFFRVTRAFHTGISGNSSYPAYRYPLAPLPVVGEYGAFLSGYWNEIRKFVGRVTRAVKPGDPAVRRWAGEIARHVPGFPDEHAIFARDNLPAALATFISNVSVVHSADHESYAQVPVNEMPLRLRRPPPRAPGGPPLDRRTLVRFEDLFRHLLAREMYFKATPVRRLIDADYRFTSRALGRAVADFRSALALFDERLAVKRFIPLTGIASSIQF